MLETSGWWVGWDSERVSVVEGSLVAGSSDKQFEGFRGISGSEGVMNDCVTVQGTFGARGERETKQNNL